MLETIFHLFGKPFQIDTDRYAPVQKVIRRTVDTPKVGRNEVCPCGSGNKFKKCCINA